MSPAAGGLSVVDSIAAAAGVGILAAGLFSARVFGDMVSDEVRGWIDIAPRAILRLAGARLNREQRARLYQDEWLPELQFIMKEAETGPITRAVRAISFALGILLAARAVARLRPPTPPKLAADEVHHIALSDHATAADHVFSGGVRAVKATLPGPGT